MADSRKIPPSPVREVTEDELKARPTGMPIPDFLGTKGEQYLRYFTSGEMFGATACSALDRFLYIVVVPEGETYRMYTAKRFIATEEEAERELRDVMSYADAYSKLERSNLAAVITSVLENNGKYCIIFHWPVPGKVLRNFDDVVPDTLLRVEQVFDTREEAAAVADEVLSIALHGLQKRGVGARLMERPKP